MLADLAHNSSCYKMFAVSLSDQGRDHILWTSEVGCMLPRDITSLHSHTMYGDMRVAECICSASVLKARPYSCFGRKLPLTLIMHVWRLCTWIACRTFCSCGWSLREHIALMHPVTLCILTSRMLLFSLLRVTPPISMHSSLSVLSDYMFRPKWPSSEAQTLAVEESAGLFSFCIFLCISF
jgi:hypothetical protein